jgi:hypothetical protein
MSIRTRLNSMEREVNARTNEPMWLIEQAYDGSDNYEVFPIGKQEEARRMTKSEAESLDLPGVKIWVLSVDMSTGHDEN